MELTQSPGERVQASHDWFGFTDLIEQRKYTSLFKLIT